MAMQRRTTPYGQPAYAALRAALTEVQGGDPLAPVTVLVHSNAVGVAARRWLAANGGVAAAQFLTAFRLAELLGGPALAGADKRPLSTPVIDVAVRRALAAEPGVFATISGHQATVTALRDAHRELRHLSPATLGRLGAAGSARAREVVRVHRRVQSALAREWYDEADLLRLAAEHAGQAPGRTIVFLPQRTRPTEAALFAALAEHGNLVVIEGITTDPESAALDTVDTSDADEEVREAVRTVADAVHTGTPLHRIAIVWPRDQPYARLVAEHLDEALIPWNGRSGTALHERLVARLVLDVLRLDRRGIRRADLFTLLAHVPARTAEHTPVPRQWWERISRDAGVAGDGDWQRRLTDFAADRRARGGSHHERDAEAAEALQAFVAELRGLLGPPAQAATWRHWSDLAHGLVLRWLGGHRGVAGLPVAEAAAHQAVQAALDRLANLDSLAGPVTRAVFADTLEAELDTSPGRVGRIGTGLHAGPLSFAVGQTFDLAVVLGACEGVLPGAPPSEALLADSDRALADGALPLDAERVAEQKAQLWAVLAGTARAVLTSPRGDLRATAQRQPSRWLRELVGAQPVPARRVPSFAAGVAGAAFPATTGQHRLRALQQATRAGQAFADIPLVGEHPALRLGQALIAARSTSALTEYDGDLSGLHIEPLGSHPISPTRLEAWVACPHAWFMQYVLGVEPVEQPDEQLQISPKDRGTLVHDALDEFHQRVVAGDLPQPGAAGWGPVHRQALLQAFEHAAGRMERGGLVGRTAFWMAEQTRQRHELMAWLHADSQKVSERGAQVLASEHRFGTAQQPPAVVHLPDGATVQMRGAVDRIDRCADGSLVVTDHKTGGATSYKGISEADPTAAGTRFQLPAYAAAALAITGMPAGTPVLAEYGFFAKGGFARVGGRLTTERWDEVGQHLARVLSGIRSGLFVALPQKAQYRLSFVRCPYCDPDGLGTAERWAEFERKVTDPRVLALLGLDADTSAESAGGDDD